MPTSPSLTPDAPLFVHANQLVRLDQMMAEGRGDSPEADSLRDEMEQSWYRMSPDELEIARQLSADLYTLHADSIVQHPSDFKVYSPDLALRLAALMGSGNYLQALRTIQDRSSDISIERASLFRAILYRSLGLPEIGLVFFQHVAAPAGISKSPSSPLLGFLWQHVNFDSATVTS
jgi:hypothetical protein